MADQKFLSAQSKLKTGISGSEGGVSCHVPHDSETDFNSAARILPKKPNPRIPTGTAEAGVTIYFVSKLRETERVQNIVPDDCGTFMDDEGYGCGLSQDY